MSKNLETETGFESLERLDDWRRNGSTSIRLPYPILTSLQRTKYRFMLYRNHQRLKVNHARTQIEADI